MSPRPGQLGLFEPHNEHWTTLPILVFRALDAVFGVSTYWPYVLLLVVVHLAIVVLLWHVMVRSAIDPWLALGFVAIIAIPGVGFENLTNVWQVQLISPLALGLGALLLLPERGPLGWRDGVASLLLTIGMACSGLGITMLGVVALVALVRRGWRVALRDRPRSPRSRTRGGTSRTGVNSPTSPTLSYREVPGFVWDGLTDALGDVVRLRSLGVVIVLATFVWLVCQLLRRPLPRTLLFPAVLALGAVVSLTLTGWRRATITEGALSRYAYITIVLVLPLVAAALDWLRPAPRARAGRRGRTGGHGRAPRGDRDRAGPDVRRLRRQHRRVQARSRRRRSSRPRSSTRKGTNSSATTPCSSSRRRSRRRRSSAMDRAGKLPSLDGLREDDRHTVLARLDLALLPGAIAGLTQNPAAVQLGEVHGATTAPATGVPNCVLLDAPRAGATAAAGHEGRRHGRPAGRRTDRHGGGTTRWLRAGRERRRVLDPKADLVLNIGPLDGPRDGGAVRLTLPRGTTRLCGVS